MWLWRDCGEGATPQSTSPLVIEHHIGYLCRCEPGHSSFQRRARSERPPLESDFERVHGDIVESVSGSELLALLGLICSSSDSSPLHH